MAVLDLDARQEEAASLSDERVEVFTLNGVTYDAPAKPPASLALKFLAFQRDHSDEVDLSMQWLITTMMGAQAYEALMDFEGLDPIQLMTVFQVCAELVLGAIEDPKDG